MEEIEYVDASNVAEGLEAAVEAMKPCEALPVAKSFAVAKEEHSLDLLRAIAGSYHVGIVVIDWPQVFEVQKLPDGLTADLFYMSIDSPKDAAKDRGDVMPTSEDEKDSLKTLFEIYLTSDAKDWTGYKSGVTAAMIEESVIPHSLICRKLGATKCFRKQKGKLAACIHALVERGTLEPILETIAKREYGTIAKLYKINL